jgi:hypothetical protein
MTTVTFDYDLGDHVIVMVPVQVPCPHCDGTGAVTLFRRQGENYVLYSAHACDHCRGLGWGEGDERVECEATVMSRRYEDHLDADPEFPGPWYDVQPVKGWSRYLRADEILRRVAP